MPKVRKTKWIETPFGRGGAQAHGIHQRRANHLLSVESAAAPPADAGLDTNLNVRPRQAP